MSNTHTLRKQVENAADHTADLAEGAGEALNRTVDKAVDRSVEAVAAVGRKAGKAADKLEHTQADAGEALAEKLALASESLKAGKEATLSFLDDVMEGASKLSRRAGRYVRENPGKTFAAVTLVTLVGAAALRRSRNSTQAS
jgi:ElaB/YqjD/DUF883 family membrane-anchored ribosome-binding protein